MGGVITACPDQKMNRNQIIIKIISNIVIVKCNFLKVSGTPNATRLSTGLAHVRLSWYTVSGATGYEVYYQLSSNTPVSISNTINATVNITLGVFSENYMYTFYVVSYISNGSAALLSENSSTVLTFSNYKFCLA